ncbi:MAG: NTP transferase domain-containing protein [Solirubrobacterales bacterium]
MKALGAVLAGGAAARLGGAKATAELAGRPLIAYSLEALGGAGLELVVVAKRDSLLPALEIPVVVEPDEPRHPLTGVVAALRHADGRPALVCACDTPFITLAALETLAASGCTTIGRTADRLHPLLALYMPDTLAPLERALASNDSATLAAQGLGPAYLDISEGEAFNVNTPEDLARAETMLTQLRL